MGKRFTLVHDTERRLGASAGERSTYGTHTEHVRSTYGARTEHIGKNHIFCKIRRENNLMKKRFSFIEAELQKAWFFPMCSVRAPYVLRTCSVRAPDVLPTCSVGIQNCVYVCLSICRQVLWFRLEEDRTDEDSEPLGEMDLDADMVVRIDRRVGQDHFC